MKRDVLNLEGGDFFGKVNIFLGRVHSIVGSNWDFL